ncbi:3'-5' exonuclease [Streptomyces sp. NBRC 110465]|uniref:3'-5' exonuclease n=1 Tax=Streptomyces sp. NBRC 110465 TaxID=1897621 RepID=UPI00191C8EB8|nr:3'-5' exonuclease [Streptomyces sp. NBRC 110465]
MTVRQLEEAGRRRTPGQKPRAYLRYRTRYGGGNMIELYHVDDTRAVQPLSPRQQAQKLARRTCILCETVGDSPLPERSQKRSPWLPVSGRICLPCANTAYGRWERTCRRCGTEFQHKDSVPHYWCTACHEARKRGEEIANRLTRRHCPDCTVQTATREEIEAADAADDFRQALAFPRTCEPCKAERRRQAAEAERASERERWDELGPVRQWARRVMAAPHEFAILDTETTGLEWDAKIVEISVTDGAGNVLLDTLVHPGVPIPEEASAIHGITDENVKDADRFGTVLPRLTRALEGRRVIIYQKEFDTGVLAYELDRHYQAQAPALTGLEPSSRYERHPEAAAWMEAQQWDRCAMLAYAVHEGNWSDYWGGWSWPRLNGGHRALGDCRKVAERIKEMAERPDPF